MEREAEPKAAPPISPMPESLVNVLTREQILGMLSLL
jgi:hypothetical protein